MDLGAWCNGTRFVSLEGHRLSWLMKISRFFSFVLGSVATAPPLNNVSFCLDTFHFIAHWSLYRRHCTVLVAENVVKCATFRCGEGRWLLPYKCLWCVFLGAFEWSRKATVSFVMSVRLHVSARRPLDGFPWNLVLRTFMEICRGTPSLVHVGQKYPLLFVKT